MTRSFYYIKFPSPPPSPHLPPPIPPKSIMNYKLFWTRLQTRYKLCVHDIWIILKQNAFLHHTIFYRAGGGVRDLFIVI